MFSFMGVAFSKEGSAPGKGVASAGSTGAAAPSLDFSKASNSMYIPTIMNITADTLPAPEQWQPQRIFSRS